MPEQTPDHSEVTPRDQGTAPGRPAADMVGDPNTGAIGEALAPVGGFGVTFSTLFKRTVTEQYPFEKEIGRAHV